jgi:serine/threonine-protein kinase
LTHPNTVAIYDFGRSADGVFYYAMEYLGEGIDLERLVAEHGPQPSARVVSILAQVCGALHEAHLKAIIHRGIKPANVILCERGGLPDVAKVADYGLVADPPARGTEHVGPTLDLYALGALGRYLLTGAQELDGPLPRDVCPQELAAVLDRCLATNPEERYRTAKQVRAELRSLALQGWSDDDARTWWRSFRDGTQTAAAASASELTIRVDLVEREPGVLAVST